MIWHLLIWAFNMVVGGLLTLYALRQAPWRDDSWVEDETPLFWLALFGGVVLFFFAWWLVFGIAFGIFLYNRRNTR